MEKGQRVDANHVLSRRRRYLQTVHKRPRAPTVHRGCSLARRRRPASATSEEHATEGDLFHRTERQYARRQRESGGIRCTVWLAPVWVAVGRLKTPDIPRMPVPHAKLGG